MNKGGYGYCVGCGKFCWTTTFYCDECEQSIERPSDDLERPLRGKMGEEAIEADSGAVAIWGKGMGREGRVMRNVQLGREEW